MFCFDCVWQVIVLDDPTHQFRATYQYAPWRVVLGTPPPRLAFDFAKCRPYISIPCWSVCVGLFLPCILVAMKVQMPPFALMPAIHPVALISYIYIGLSIMVCCCRERPHFSGDRRGIG